MSGLSSPNSLVDKRIGSAYPAVALVAEYIPEIKQLSELLNGISTGLRDYVIAEMNGLISAAIQEEAEVRITENTAFATKLTDMYVRVGNSETHISDINEAFAMNNLSVGTRITELESTVGTNNANVTIEIETLATNNLAIATQVTELTTTVGQNKASIDNSLQTLSTANLAMAEQITSLTSTTNTNFAGIEASLTTLTTSDVAMATQISELTTVVGSNHASVTTSIDALTAADLAFAQSITSLSALVDDNAANIITEQETRVTDIAALAQQITTLTANVATANSAITTEQQVRANVDIAIANQVTSLGARILTAEGTLVSQATAISNVYTKAQTDSAVSGMGTTLTSSFQSADTSTLNSSKTYADGVAGTALTNAKTYSDALVATEATTRASAISAEATSRTALAARVTSAESAITTNATAISNVYTKAQTDSSVSGMSTSITAAYQAADTSALNTAKTYADAVGTTALDSAKSYANAAISTESTTRAAADTANATSITNLTATVTANKTDADTKATTNSAAITAEQTARANADTALSNSISTVSATANAKNKTYFQTTAPTSGMTSGDIWYDSDDNNKSYRYSGSAWDATADTRIASNTAAITAEQTARATADSANATSINTVAARLNTGGDIKTAITAAATAATNAQTTADGKASASSVASLTTTVGGHTTELSTLSTSIDGILGQWGVSITQIAGGAKKVSGIKLFSDGTTSTFDVLADMFRVSLPTGLGSKQAFVLGNVNGVATLGLSGDMYIDGSVTANKLAVTSLSAVSANMGTITAGIARNAAGTSYVNLDATGTATFLNVNSGQAYIRADGYAVFNNAYVRGDITATSLTANIVTTDKIVANSVTELFTASSTGDASVSFNFPYSIVITALMSINAESSGDSYYCSGELWLDGAQTGLRADYDGSGSDYGVTRAKSFTLAAGSHTFTVKKSAGSSTEISVFVAKR